MGKKKISEDKGKSLEQQSFGMVKSWHLLKSQMILLI